MTRLSIIVPMYNVEPFVEKCLCCLEDQDILSEEYEIIFVNDGSPDNSRDVVIRYQKKFDNIVLIDQENKGVSAARNIGIERAKGKYILFIDPDDYVETNSFGHALDAADEMKSQVSFLGFTVLNENGSIKNMVLNINTHYQIKSGIEAYIMSHIKDRPDPDRIYGILFDTVFLNRNNLRFLHGVPYLEDGELITRILCLADRCIFIRGSFYWRTIRPGSATNSTLFYSKLAINGFVKSAKNMRDFRDTMTLLPTQIEFMNQPIVKYVTLSISATGGFHNIKKFIKLYSTLKKNDFKNLKIEGCNNEYKKLGSLYNYSGFILYLYLNIRPLIRFFRTI